MPIDLLAQYDTDHKPIDLLAAYDDEEITVPGAVDRPPGPGITAAPSPVAPAPPRQKTGLYEKATGLVGDILVGPAATYMNPEARARGQRFASGVAQGFVGSNAALVGGGLAWAFESELGEDLYNNAQKWVQSKAPEDPDFIDALASGIGSSAMFWIPGFGIAKGAGLLARVSKGAAMWMGAGAAGSIEALTEAGGVYMDTLNKTGSREEAENAARWTFGLNIPLNAITNKLGIFAEKGGPLKRALGSMIEAPQEILQETISTKAKGEKLTAEQIYTAGGVGLILGPVGGGISAKVFPAPKADVKSDAINKMVWEDVNHWLGAKEVQKQRAWSVAAQQQRKIRDTVGEKGLFGRKNFGENSKNVDRALHIYAETKAFPDEYANIYNDLTKEQQAQIDAAQNLTPEQQAIGEEMAREYKLLWGLANSAGIIHGFRDAYANRIYKRKDDKAASQEQRKFGVTTRHGKPRTFLTVAEAWKNDMELAVTGATNNLAIYKEEIYNTLHDKAFRERLKGMTDTEGNPLLTTRELTDTKEKYKRLEHYNMKDWRFAGIADPLKIDVTDPTTQERLFGEYGITPEELQVAEQKASGVIPETLQPTTKKKKPGETKTQLARSKNFFQTPEGVLLERVELFAPESLAQDLNNILGVSRLKGKAWADNVTKYNAVVKSFRLMTSLFHHLAFLRSAYLGGAPFGEAYQNIRAGEGFFKTLAQLTPRQIWKAGNEAILNMTPEAELLIRNGTTLGRIQDWEESILEQEDTFVGRMMDKHGATRIVKDKINAFRKAQTHFLFHVMGPGLKMKIALIELKAELKRNPGIDPNTAAEYVSNLMNDDFGGLNLQRLRRDPTLQHVFRFFALAPDWTESNIRSAVKAVKSGTKEETAMYRRFWARIITKSMLATLLANALLQGDELPESYVKAWEAGNLRYLDLDITPIYKMFGGETEARKFFSIAGHFKDPLRFALHPIKSAHYKGSPVYAAIHSAIEGEDWAGREFTELPEFLETGEAVRPSFTFVDRPNKYAQVPSYLANRLKQAVPIQVEQLLNWWAGETEAFDAIGVSLGAGIRTTYEPTRAQRRRIKETRREIQRLKKSRRYRQAPLSSEQYRQLYEKLRANE
jgi:hypothetical protein